MEYPGYGNTQGALPGVPTPAFNFDALRNYFTKNGNIGIPKPPTKAEANAQAAAQKTGAAAVAAGPDKMRDTALQEGETPPAAFGASPPIPMPPWVQAQQDQDRIAQMGGA